MTSGYAVRFYELLVQWNGVGEREIAVSWLREQFDLPPSYSDISELKRRVLTPAVTQINKYSDLWVEWDQRKAGRDIVAFIFRFGHKDKKLRATESQTSARKKTITKKDLERAARPGESWDDVRRRLIGK